MPHTSRLTRILNLSKYPDQRLHRYHGATSLQLSPLQRNPRYRRPHHYATRARKVRLIDFAVLLTEIWNRLLEKPEPSRTAAEQNIVDVNCLLIDIESGGWLYNISPAAGEGRIWTRLRRAADAATAIGATTMAGLLRQVIVIVESADVQQPGVWQDFIRAAERYCQLSLTQELN